MMAYAEFGAGRMRELECESCRAKIIYPRIEPGKNIVYAGIEARKKDLCKGLCKFL